MAIKEREPGPVDPRFRSISFCRRTSERVAVLTLGIIPHECEVSARKHFR
jgi:hypothetical protein